ncbi:MAG: hypothetical protein ACFFAH_15875 [Promethearchaeota archaeon]
MIFQEGADIMGSVIDPMLLVFYALATIVFIATAYKKGEIRVFGLALLLMTGGIVWCILEVEILEATFILIASVVGVIASIILRIKTRIMEV